MKRSGTNFSGVTKKASQYRLAFLVDGCSFLVDGFLLRVTNEFFFKLSNKFVLKKQDPKTKGSH